MLLFSTVVVCFILIEKIIEEEQTKQTKTQHEKVGYIHKKKQGERYQQKSLQNQNLFFTKLKIVLEMSILVN